MTGPNVAGLAVGLALGAPMMLVGILQLVQHPESVPPVNYLKFLVGSDLLHDFVVAPVAALVAYFVLRRIPAFTRAPLRAALFGTAVAIGIAWPALRGYGRAVAPDNTSLQPLNYATALGTVIAVLWALAAIWLAAALVSRSRRRPHEADGTQVVPRSGP